ncbi:MAG TPA: hypothetical protein ENI34_10650 [candidate division WOR-3 bacterium]|uniref:Trimeric autotransporter adhesin YadA-like head domain-containing protein n=1 Tax=candidate division WOR-3 bacterium TaxID=2052148 RepID=A0A9C9EPM6_UNCW3|nr:hypothetical protein [candidate division WOR-3 bacterium]
MNPKKYLATLCLIIAAGLSAEGRFTADYNRLVPKMLNYQGYLTDTLQIPIDDTLDMIFRIYDASTGGNELWNETQTGVIIERGVFSVILGSVNAIPDSVFTGGTDRWLELVVDGDTLSPRTRIVSVGYAYTATYSDTAEYARNASADNDWVRGTPDSVLFTANYLGIARGGAGNVLYGDSAHTHVNLGVACTTGVSGQNYCYATIGGGYRNVASGYYSTVDGGVWNTARDSFTTIGGGYSNTANNSYTTVSGGFRNIADSSNATVGGGYFNTASGFSATVGGGYGNTAGGNYATVSGGVNNTTMDTLATIAGGVNNKIRANFATIGGGKSNFVYGIYGIVAGGYIDTIKASYGGILSGYNNLAGDSLIDTAAVVVGGWNNSVTAKYTFVGGGKNNTASGHSATVAGGEADTSAAPYSFATNYHTFVDSSDTNSAAFTTSHTTASNQVRAAAFSTGTLVFTMDHPSDPMNKILNQYAVGSDEVILFYRGVVTIGSDGKTVVNLPDYFDKINKNPMIQLTGVGSSDIYVAEDVAGNRFVIGGKPGTKVYWTVTAERKDVHARIAKILTPVEQPKTDHLIGHSLDDDAMIGIYDRIKTQGDFQWRTEEGRRVHNESKISERK